MQAKMDLTRNDDIIKTMQKIKPDVIVHAAAMADVDLCEQEQEIATRINVEATSTISEQATKIGSFLVYVSTDYVFDGKKGMRVESDIPNPINHYGRSKLGGENAVQDTARKWCIARTSIPYGIHPTLKRFLTAVAQNLKEKKEFSLTTDQYICPTYLPNLSKMIIEIATRQIAGIIHVSGATRLSRYQIGAMLADKMGLDKKFLKPVKISEMKNWTAKRPQDSSLDTSKAARILKEKPLGIDPGLDYFIKQLRPLLE